MKFLESDGIKQLLRKIFFLYKKTWIGTEAEWNALTTSEKNKYDIAHITDASCQAVEIANKAVTGNMNPITSNAAWTNRALDWDNATVTEYDGTSTTRVLITKAGFYGILLAVNKRANCTLSINGVRVASYWEGRLTDPDGNVRDSVTRYFYLNANDTITCTAGNLIKLFSIPYKEV